VTVEEIEALDLEWAQKEIPHPPDCFGWSPYPLGLFAPLLEAALAHSKGPRFLDVGSGIGTKLLLARQAGLDPEGVEQIEEFAVFADRLGFTTHRADVRGWDGYDGYDIVYVNHPLINTELEEPFELWLHEQLKPGTVLMQANDCVAPDWPAIVDNRGAWNGVWQRP
jgi:hypothetical protein